MRHMVKLASILIVVGSCSVPASAQSSQISGQVTDPQLAAVPNAEVRVVNQANRVERKIKTNDQGFYTAPFLEPGQYQIFVQAPGFSTAASENLTLNVGQTLIFNVRLTVGPTTQAITVTGGATLVNTTDGSVSTVVDRQFVENLPLNGRSFQSLIGLAPGVVLAKATNGQMGQFSVNGQRANANYFMVDGVSANIGSNPANVPGQSDSGSLPAFSALGGTNNLVSVDALQEFKLLTSTFAPEFGRTPGAQISIVTRSGTNDFHGTLFEYFRNDALDANDWFANQNGLRKPPERQNDFGGVFGGPILRNRTFFFFSYEGLRLRLPQTGLKIVPALSARQMASSSIQPFLNAFPLPNGSDLGNSLAQFATTYSDPSTINATSLRIDHTFGPKLTVFGRYNYAPSETTQRANSLNTISRTAINSSTLTVGATILLIPNISNDFRINYSKNEGTLRYSLDNFGGAELPPDSLLFPSPASSRDSFFQFLLSGTSNWVEGFFAADTPRQINLVDTLSLSRGVHQVKLGLDYLRLFPIFDRFRYAQGPFFLSVAQVLGGSARSVQLAALSGPRLPVFSRLSLFAQDTWVVTPRLTLTYGLRWEYDPAPHDSNGNDPLVLTGLEDPSTIGLAPAGTPLYKTSYDNLGPRIGVAYKSSRRSTKETVLRGGFGIFYDTGNSAAASAFALSPPYYRSTTVPGSNTTAGVPFPLDAASAAPPSFTLTGPFSAIYGQIDPHFGVPYTYQWNVSVEQSLGQNQTITTSYVAAVGRRLPRQELLSGLSGQNPTFPSIDFTRSEATSDYHALQLQWKKRLSRGAQALGSYTWSHSIDDVSSDTSLEPPLIKLDPKQERGSSDFDVRHALNLGLTYALPASSARSLIAAVTRGFSFDTTFAARSATSVNVVTGTNQVGGFSSSRPDLVLGVPLYIYDSSIAGGKRINPAAFTVPVGRQGNLGRNALRGFSMWQLDFAIRRDFHLTEKVGVQFRSELFNIFNHPNFGDPGFGTSVTNALNNPLFGRSTVMLGRSLGSGGTAGGLNPLYQLGGPRSIQLALRLSF